MKEIGSTINQSKLPLEPKNIVNLNIAPIQKFVETDLKVLEIIKYLSQFNLGINIPHYHPIRAEINFAILPPDWAEIRTGNQVTFGKISKIDKNCYKPTGWRYSSSKIIETSYADKITIQNEFLENIFNEFLSDVSFVNYLAYLSEYGLGINMIEKTIYEEIISEQPFGENQIIIKKLRTVDDKNNAVSWTWNPKNEIIAAKKCCEPQRLKHRRFSHV